MRRGTTIVQRCSFGVRVPGVAIGFDVDSAAGAVDCKIKCRKIKSGNIRIEHHELLALSGNLQPLESSPQSVFQWLSRAIVKSHTWFKIGTRTLQGTDMGVTIASHGFLSTMMMGAA